MKKSIVKSIALGIGGLLSLSFLFGVGSNNQSINKEDSDTALLATSVKKQQLINRDGVNTEGTPLPTSGTLSAGTYYLDSDSTITSILNITSGDVIVNLNGHTLNGGGRDKGTFYVTGGTLTVNGKDETTGQRGLINNAGGYYPGSGYSYGGALYITKGEATFNDLDITNCQANWGGAIYMSNSAVTLNNCNLSGNKATNGYGYPCAIDVGDSSTAGTGLTVNGGEMFSNDAGISLGNKAKATINGAYIHDNERFGVRVEDSGATLNISGDTIIKNNSTSTTSGARANLRINGTNQAKIAITSALGDNASIGITMTGTQGIFTASADTSLNDFSKFFSDDANYAVAKNSDGQLYLTEAVATVTSGATVTEYATFSDAVSAWGSASNGANLTLLKDSTTESTISVSDTKTFDLNGCGINANGSSIPIFTVNAGGDFTLNDSGSTTHYYTLANVESNGAAFATICDEETYEAAAADARGTFTGGYLTGANPSAQTGIYPGGGIYILANGVATMNGGTIIGNIASNCAGGVGSYGTFIMNDGNIIYNRARRGAVLASAGEMTINGGHISYNTGRGTQDCGTSGAVMIYGNCTSFIITGGYFTNNFAKYAGFASNIETISISGNPVFKDNIGCGASGTDTTEINAWLCRRSNLNVYFDIVGELTEGAEIGVTIENTSTGVITNSSDISYNDESKFFSDASYAVAKNSDGQLYLTNAVATVTSGETVTEYNNFDDALAAWTDETTLKLLKDVTMSDTINVNNNATLDLNGHGIKATGTDYSVLTINNGGKLIIIDSGDTTQYFTITDRYDGNGAGFATVCDKATYDAASENLRGTFQGGYITGGNIINTGFYQSKAGAITVMEGGELDFKAGTIIGNSGGSESPGGVSSFGTFTLNGGNIIYNRGRRGSGVFLDKGTFVMNSGSIEYNTGVGATEYGTSALHSYGNTKSISLKGGSISHNYAKYGGILTPINIFLSGDFVAANNIACGSSGTDAANRNIILSEGALISGCITGNTPIGISFLGSDTGVFTNNTDTSLNDPSKFVSDNTNYAIGVYPADSTKAGQLFIGNKVTVTYTTEYGTAPASDVVADGSIIYNEPTSPSQEGYVFIGWYKDEEFENAWDFATDTVTSNTTLYAKWYDEATANVIKLINDIGDLTYAGGVNDSLDDIITAKAAYDALTPSQQAIVNKENKDVLDHDILTYRHVDNVADLIKEIPAASDSQEYYGAVEAALAAYKALTDEEKNILNASLDFQYKKTLDDNIAAKEVIELIQDIGEVTYNGGQDDSKDDINAALDAYNNLTDDQKASVNNANKDALDEAKETYDNVDEAVNLINSIGDINHGGESDSKEAIDAAKDAYESLTPEEKALVASYNNSEKTLEDAEEVYDVLVKIDDIGEGDDDEKIKEARDAYDALTPEQKDKVNDESFQKLIAAENRSSDAKKQANILFIVFLILSILLIVSGLIVLFVLLKRRKDENNSNNKQVKVASISGLLPLLILVSYFRSTKFIILYILIAVGILIWLANLILFVSKKRQKEVKVEAKPETVISAVSQDKQTEIINEDEEEVETITDEKGNVFQIRFIKSFTAKLIQSPDETKKYYEELKNEVLSYKKTNSRISWHYDAVNSGRNYVLKFVIRGKTLCVYLPLNADDYANSKYKVEKAESKRYEDVPCLYRIKNDRRLGYAKELIEVVANNLGLEKEEEQHEVYSNLPYEPNKPLVARGLIKEQKIQVNKPASEPAILETKTNSDGDEVVVSKDASGNIFEIRYIKSFTAKLIQSPDETKKYYEELKNEVLSYKKTNSRVSWHYDAINSGREYVLKFAIRGKTLCVYLPLDSENLEDKYKVEKAESKRYEDVPCLYRIKNDRRLGYAKELIEVVANNLGLEKDEEQHEVYSNLPYEENKPLIARGLIKELKVKVNKPDYGPVVLESKVNSEGDEVVLTKDSSGNLFEIRYIKSFTAKLSQSEAEVKDYYTILKNYVFSYKGIHSRVSWHYDAINIGRDYILKFAIRGKTLCVYFALDASKLDNKYKVEEAKGNRYIEVPCLYRIKNDRRCEYAKELIDLLMKEHGLNQGDIPNEDYHIKKESTKALLDKGLIKEVKSKIHDQKVIEHYESITVSKADEVMSDEKAEASIQEVIVIKHKEGSKVIINIDTLSKNYNNGDEVTLDSLIEKGLVPSKAGHIKVLARGELDKKLHVVANDYSLQAIKMIVLVGGTVKKIK